jgi:uncharacterized protein (DUF1330 family)
MAAYIVFTREKMLDPGEMAIYEHDILATFQGYHIKVLAAYGRHEVLEGANTEGVVIAEFPTFEEAKAWYDSPAYQKVAEHRFKGAIYRGLLVQGV